jgi:FkbM family methyltransferase
MINSREDKGTNAIFWHGIEKSWDATSIYLWKNLAENAAVVFDIGANTGLYALAARAVNRQSKVYAIEPSRNVFDMLKKNTLINDFNIELCHLAFSDRKGELDFHDLDIHTAVGSLKANENIKDHPRLQKYRVPVTTLKQFVEENGITRLDLLSIDVEMNEPEVLAGMGELIEKYRPTFIIEVLTDEVGHQIESYFENKGYIYFSIHEGKGVQESAHLKAQPFASKSFNYLICSGETAQKLGLKKSNISNSNVKVSVI